MAKYRKKPVIVDAEVYRFGMEDGWGCESDTCLSVGIKDCLPCQYFKPYIQTLEGRHYISRGDYIITGIKGERYPCKPDVFEATYELVKEE